MDIKKYLLEQIKTYESLMKDLEEEPKQKESYKPKIEYKQKPNSYLLEKIDSDIKNQKRFTNYYKSIKTGMPIVQEDDNIRLINNSNNLDSSLENQFNFLMSKYVKDQATLNELLNNLTPEMISEFVHNFAIYEPEIRKYKGQYVDSNLFLDKIRNMLLKNVNLKYPSTRNLNSAIDASRESDIEMQRAFEEKNRAVDEPISESDITSTNNLQMIENIINWIRNKSYCSESFELPSLVQDKFKNYNINLERFQNLREELTKLSNDHQYNFEILYTDMKGIYTGEIYNSRNQTINNFINSIKQQSESFRTFLIKLTIKDFNNKIDNTIYKEEFRKFFVDYFKIKFNEISLDKNFKELKLNKLYELSNYNIILIIDEMLPAILGDITTLQKTKNNIDRNKLIKTLKEETNNKDNIKYDDLTTEQLLGYYKTIFGKEYIGTGLLKQTEKKLNKKYFIDTNKLNNNVLEVRYNKNRHLTGIKTQIIGSGVKNIISNIINDDNMNEKEYDNLSDNERHLIRTILNMLEKSHLIKNKDEEFNEKFQILLGSYNAGNNSEILKNQLKQYVLHGMRLNIIPRNMGHSMLIELSL
jgi:uncharacterized protein YegP (UPF0339 family)